MRHKSHAAAQLGFFNIWDGVNSGGGLNAPIYTDEPIPQDQVVEVHPSDQPERPAVA